MQLTTVSNRIMTTVETVHAINADPMDFPIWATATHALIFVLGVFGNIVLILAVLRTRYLHSSTYCYLVSLAFADLVVLLSAVPDAIVSHHIGFRWISGQAGCSLMVFSNFLGINAGSLSILGFTVDRYIAAHRTLLIVRYCTWHFARKAVYAIWLFTILYCCPWFWLTVVRKPVEEANFEICDLRLSPMQYRYFFITDMLIFYIVPLIVSMGVFTKLGMALRRSIKDLSLLLDEPTFTEVSTGSNKVEINSIPQPDREGDQDPDGSADVIKLERDISQLRRRYKKMLLARTRVFRILMIIVVLFAVTWLPYRGLLVYNTFAETMWLHPAYLFFAKSCIYFNCAINPYLYNLLSPRFRHAVYVVLCHSSKDMSDQLS